MLIFWKKGLFFDELRQLHVQGKEKIILMCLLFMFFFFEFSVAFFVFVIDFLSFFHLEIFK